MLLWKCDCELALYLNNVADVGFKLLICFRYYLTWTWFVITLIHTLIDELYLWTLCNVWHVCWIIYDLGCILVESSPLVVLDGLPGLYGLKYDSVTACGLPLYLCSYKLDGYATTVIISSSIYNAIPYELLYHKNPDCAHLCVFGCLCYLNLATMTPHILPWSTACMFLS